MIALAIIPQPGSNYVAISDEFYKRLEQIKKDVPDDIKLNIALDQTKFIKKSISEVEETLMIAFVLVILIIYLFFRDWLIAIRPLIDIPVSLDRRILYHVPDGFYHQCTYHCWLLYWLPVWWWMMVLW